MEAVCFDMDGVLVDSEDYWVERERADLLPRVVPEADVDLAEITGMNYREIYDYLAATYEVGMDREAFVAWYDEAATTVYGEEVALLPGLEELLVDLDRAGVPVAIVSSSPPAWIDVVRERFDLSVDAVVSADTFDGPGKPDPALYEHAAARLDTDPERTVAVEDSAHGVASAKAAGMTVLGYRFGTSEGADLSDADVRCETPAEVGGAIRTRLG